MVQMRTHTCGELRLSDAGKQVKLVGFMENVRAVSANLLFCAISTAPHRSLWSPRR